MRTALVAVTVASFSRSGWTQTLPAGFSAARLFATTTLSGPTALAFTADGRMLITLQGGALRVAQNGSVVPTPALLLGTKVCSTSERGLLGIAVDPQFAVNQFVYLYYTFRKFPNAANPCLTGQPTSVDNPVNRVSRFVLPPANVIDPMTETVLVDNIPSPNGNHNGGDLHFGKDGLLYVSIGDGGADYAGDSGSAGANDAARTNGALGPGALTATSPAVAGFLNAADSALDVDGDGTADALTDGLLIVRPLFGLRGPHLIQGAVGADATRKTAAQIETYMLSLLP